MTETKSTKAEPAAATGFQRGKVDYSKQCPKRDGDWQCLLCKDHSGECKFPEGTPKRLGQNKFTYGQTIRLPEDRFLEITKIDYFGPSLHYGGTLATRRAGELSQYDYVWMPVSFIDSIGING
jgi:hypothetical protein